MRRTCIGCRKVRPVEELVRVVRQEGGRLLSGRTLSGRGAWLCAESLACVDLADKRKAFSRALRGPVSQSSVASLRAGMAERARIVGDTGHDCGEDQGN